MTSSVPPSIASPPVEPAAAADGSHAPIVRLSGLTKHYGEVQALRGVDMVLPPGPVGLLGPNGAGKTTMIGLLLGLLEPTSGEAVVAGLTPTSRANRVEIRKRVGYMPESDCLLPGMSGVELVATLARLTGLTREDAMTRAHEVLDYVELEEARYRPLDGYSTGMKQRLKLAQALVHDPDLLLLDEPTNGLDPAGRRHMLSLVEDLGRNQGKNILLCSHLLPDVERTCDHVVVLVQGRSVLQGEIAALTAADAQRIRVGIEHVGGVPMEARNVELRRDHGLELETEISTGGSTAGQRLLGALESEGYGAEWGAGAQLVVTLPEGVEDADGICAIAAREGVRIESLDPVRSSLEEVFLQAVDDDEAGAAPEEVA